MWCRDKTPGSPPVVFISTGSLDEHTVRKTTHTHTQGGQPPIQLDLRTRDTAVNLPYPVDQRMAQGRNYPTPRPTTTTPNPSPHPPMTAMHLTPPPYPIHRWQQPRKRRTGNPFRLCRRGWQSSTPRWVCPLALPGACLGRSRFN